MKLRLSEAWYDRYFALEEGSDIAAGSLEVTTDPTFCGEALASGQSPGSDIALGTLIQFARRRRGLSQQGLSEQAQVDLADVVTIETGHGGRPTARTLYCLAESLGLPYEGLLDLSGNTAKRDERLRHAAVRFAAQTGKTSNLSDQEMAALEQFVAALSEV
jgi:HTH-type transcriptional regulator, competence development regulator